jgi:hypothetical protein
MSESPSQGSSAKEEFPLNDRYQLRGVRIGAVIAVAAVAAFLVWYFAIRDTGSDNGGGSTNAAKNVVGPEAATQPDISDLASKNGQPIYWAGTQPNTSDMELTETAAGGSCGQCVYVRYLTGNASIGTPKPSYLTIGTYPFQNSIHAINVIAKEPGAKTFNVANGGTAVQNSSSPTSVYVAFSDETGYEIEVYDPDPAKALDLVKSGDIQPVP